jgi:hypothetical protein
MSVCTYVRMYVCVYVYVCVYIFVYVHACIYIRVCIGGKMCRTSGTGVTTMTEKCIRLPLMTTANLRVKLYHRWHFILLDVRHSGWRDGHFEWVCCCLKLFRVRVKVTGIDCTHIIISLSSLKICEVCNTWCCALFQKLRKTLNFNTFLWLSITKSG